MRPLKVIQSITNRDAASLEKYLQEVSKIKMISAVEEVALGQLISEGDTEAMSTLTKANLRFVISVAKQYQHRGLALTDLINEGNIGLIKAAQHFDASKGFKFISYAIWRIRQSIMQALNEKGQMVRLPYNKTSLRNHIHNCTTQLEQELERAPSFEEIAQYLQVATADIEQVSNALVRHQSLDMPVGNENNETTLLDLLTSDLGDPTDRQAGHTRSLAVEVERCLASLPAIQRTILCDFYGIGTGEAMSLETIGKRLNLSAERVRQLKHKAIMQLQAGKRAALLKPFLG